MNQPVQELPNGAFYTGAPVQAGTGETVGLAQIVDMTLNRRVPVSDFQHVEHVFIWHFEEGRGQRINRMAQRWLREGKAVTVLSDRILPLPEAVNVHLIAKDSHAWLANGYIQRQIKNNTCEGEQCFSTSNMYTPYKEMIKMIDQDEVERWTGLSSAECQAVYEEIESANRAGHYFPHDEMKEKKIQQFRSILMIPLLELGCKRELSLRILIGEGKDRVFGQRQPTAHKTYQSISMKSGQSIQKSGRLVFDFYSDDISDAFEVDPLPIG